MMSRPAPDTGSSFLQRLGYYALGISLGLMILGWFQIQKMRANQSRAAPTVVDSEQPTPSGAPSPIESP